MNTSQKLDTKSSEGNANLLFHYRAPTTALVQISTVYLSLCCNFYFFIAFSLSEQITMNISKKSLHTFTANWIFVRDQHYLDCQAGKYCNERQQTAPIQIQLNHFLFFSMSSDTQNSRFHHLTTVLLFITLVYVHLVDVL